MSLFLNDYFLVSCIQIIYSSFFLLLDCICSWWGCHMLVCAFMYAEVRGLHWVSPSIILHVFDIRYLIESGVSLDEWPVPGILLSPFTDWDGRHKPLYLTFTWDKLRSLQCEITLAPLRPVLFQLVFIKSYSDYRHVWEVLHPKIRVSVYSHGI